MKTIFRMKPLWVALGLSMALEAQALTLGRLSVLSSIGQPLVAEIDVADISTEESGSLRIAVANSDAFKAAGLDYNAAVAGLSIAGRRRPDGRALLELRSTQPISEPFLDLILEMTWSTGRLVRDYTLLLDPAPNGVVQAPLVPTPTLPIASATVATPDANSQVSTPATALASSAQTSSVTARVAASPIAARAPAKAVSKSNLDKSVVKRGDTAAAIALANKPEGVSLDQMLVAMLRSNPNAFIDGNVNRLKTGVVLAIPSDEQVKSVGRSDANSSMRVQASDFQAYRQKLAGHTAAVTPQLAKREAAGSVTAKLDEKNAQPQTPDRLTLNKAGSGDAAKAIELDKIARERAAVDTSMRQAEIKKNISELGQITSAPNTPVAPSAVASMPSMPSGALTVPESTASAPVVASSATVAPIAAASMPAATPQATPFKQSASFMDNLVTSRWTLPAGGALLGLLGLGALFAVRKRQQAKKSLTANDSMNFPLTEQSTDTVFGDLGASRVDTAGTADTGEATAMVYPPSQLGAAVGDVDAVAEADVYLAYNRDVQAEEILKEAKRTQPKRADVQLKLLEIYAKRHDVESFDAQAQELHLLTDGVGDYWTQAVKLAKEAPSASALFHVSGSAFNVGTMPTAQAAYSAASLSFTPTQSSITPSMAPAQPVVSSGGDHSTSGLIDFDLSSLTLDLPQTQRQPAYEALEIEDSKLALAEEYLAIGDKVGAKALIEEVLATGHPQLVGQAHALLARIG